VATEATPALESRGFFATLLGVYVDPLATFRSIAAHPAFLAPLLAIMLVNASFTFVWLRKSDHAEVARAQIEESGWADRIPADQQGEVVARQARLLPMFAWLGPFVILPVILVGLSAVFLFTFRFFYSAETTFRQSLAVMSWSSLASYLLATTLTVIVLLLRDDWSVDPRTVVQANPAMLLERGSVAKPLRELLDSIDLFAFWNVFLLSAGYAATARRSLGSAAVGVLAWYGLYVLLFKVAMTAVF